MNVLDLAEVSVTYLANARFGAYPTPALEPTRQTRADAIPDPAPAAGRTPSRYRFGSSFWSRTSRRAQRNRSSTLRLVCLGVVAVAFGGLPTVAAAAPHDTTYISRSTGGAAGDANSLVPSVSADGTFVAFDSIATNLSAVDTNGVGNVFVRDRQTNTTTLVSRASGATGAAADDASFQPSISPNGRFVAFESRANNLSAIDNDNFTNVFVRDLQWNTTHLVSQIGGVGADGHSGNPSVANNGQVAFDSGAGNLSTVDRDGSTIDAIDVFVRDVLGADDTILVSRAPGRDGAAGDGRSAHPSISADGSRIAFASDADNLSGIDNNSVGDVFVRTAGGSTFLASRAAGQGAAGDDNSRGPSISGDGLFVAFESLAGNLSDADDPGVTEDVYVRSLPTIPPGSPNLATTTLVSRQTGAAGRGANGGSSTPSISANGRFVAFSSLATNLFAGDNNNATDVFVRDLNANTTTLASRETGANGPIGDAQSGRASISGNGRIVAFQSFANNLTTSDLNNIWDVFTRELPAP